MKTEPGLSKNYVKGVADKAEAESVRKGIKEDATWVDEIRPNIDPSIKITFRQWQEEFDKKNIPSKKSFEVRIGNSFDDSLGDLIPFKFPESESILSVEEFYTDRDPKMNEKSEYIKAGIFIGPNFIHRYKVENTKVLIGLIKYIDLDEVVDDKKICARLGIRVGPNGEILQTTDKGKLWSLQEVKILLEQQINISDNKIKEGVLKTDGKRNIFYVKSADDKSVCTVNLVWDANYRKWVLFENEFGCNWNFDQRVFSRDDLEF